MKKSRRTTDKKTLTKKGVKAALVETMFPNGITPKQTLAERIVSGWTTWRLRDEWIKQNPTEAGKVARWDDQGQKTCSEENDEKHDDLTAEFGDSFLIALLREDADFFRGIAAAISKRKRVASKLKTGAKTFDLKKFLLLKEAHKGTENVYQLAKELKKSGLAQKSESLESIRADLFRRRKKLNLPKISSKG